MKVLQREYNSSMAGRAQEIQRQSRESGLQLPRNESDQHAPAIVEVPKDEIQLAAARLYGQGLTRSQVMRVLVNLLAPVHREGKRDRTREEQESLARSKLRRWEHSDSFRDLVYEHAIVQTDMQLPKILQGVARRAKTGRVDAARLALEVTHRHNPKGEQQAPNITVQIANIPRPEK